MTFPIETLIWEIIKLVIKLGIAIQIVKAVIKWIKERGSKDE